MIEECLRRTYFHWVNGKKEGEKAYRLDKAEREYRDLVGDALEKAKRPDLAQRLLKLPPDAWADGAYIATEALKLIPLREQAVKIITRKNRLQGQLQELDFKIKKLKTENPKAPELKTLRAHRNGIAASLVEVVKMFEAMRASVSNLEKDFSERMQRINERYPQA